MILREKILLGLCAAAAIGAGVSYAPALLNPKIAGADRKPTDFGALVTEVQASLDEGKLTDREELVLTAAATQWLGNPLRERPLIITEPEEEPKEVESPVYVAPLPKYTGFIKIGTKVIAIIDGLDYRPGDIIQGGEFKLFQIYPDSIKVIRRGALDAVDVLLEKPQIAGVAPIEEKPLVPEVSPIEGAPPIIGEEAARGPAPVAEEPPSIGELQAPAVPTAPPEEGPQIIIESPIEGEPPIIRNLPIPTEPKNEGDSK